jgi:hypothetical protein
MMQNHVITDVKAARHGFIFVTYADGFSGEFDLTASIDKGLMFEPLKDEAYFKTVAIGEFGRSFGWNLEEFGEEIDFCADATRFTLETNAVKARAKAFRARLQAAE